MENINLYQFFTKDLIKKEDEQKNVMFSQDIDVSRFESSQINSNLILGQGSLRSSIFSPGTLGWKIESDGTAQLGEITLTGGTIKYGKTSFTDSTNSGYYIGQEGLYFGSASDASVYKFDISTGRITTAAGATGYKTGNGYFLGYDDSEELEQWYTPTANISDYLWGDNTTNKVGQGFSITDGQTNISSVAVWLKMKTAGQTSNTITCDIYLMDTATLLPTGASLGQASISGISNTDYVKKTFTFSTPITIVSTNSYVFVLDTSYTSGNGIYLKHRNPFGAYTSGELVRYTASWATVVNQDASFEVYSKYSDNKLYVGNSDYSLTFNSAFVDATEKIIIRDNEVSDVFAEYEKDSISFISSGQPVMRIENGGTISARRAKGLSSGFLTFYTIGIEGGASSDVINDGAGIVITEGKGGNTIKFSNQGLIVSNTIGNASTKQTIYCNALSACPLPSTDNALAKFKTLPQPKTKDKLKKPEKAHFEFKEPGKKRKYFDIDDVPDEVTFINSDGEKDIELIRVIGFCFQALKELNEEVETLKKRLNK